jgi:uncharacterized protein YggT (Ycf19 family)
MVTFLHIASAFISAFCNIALLLVRAVLSWFPGQGGAFADFINAVTEPLLYPVRKIFDLFDIRLDLPIDISFSATCILLIMIRMFLSS